MALGFLFLAIGIHLVDKHIFRIVLSPYVDLTQSSDILKNILSVISTSVITVASLIFSITVLTLSFASNQHGHRLLPNFIKRKSTQFIFGFYVGTFVYSLVTLQFLALTNTSVEVAYASVLLAIILGVCSFFLLIYFIHFVCKLIQVDYIIKMIITDLIDSIDRQFDNLDTNCIHPIQKAINQSEEELSSFAKLKYKLNACVKKSGYVQTITYNNLKKVAEKYGCVIYLKVSPGSFVFQKLEILTIYSDQPIQPHLAEKCLAQLTIGMHRSVVQDVGFGFEELSEIALRALSPSVNSAYTAIHCCDRMMEAMTHLTNKCILPRVITNKKGDVSIIRPGFEYRHIVEDAFNRLRQQAESDLTVTIHWLKLFKDIFNIKMPGELSAALFDQAKMLYLGANLHYWNKKDRDDLVTVYNAVVDAYEAANLA